MRTPEGVGVRQSGNGRGGEAEWWGYQWAGGIAEAMWPVALAAPTASRTGNQPLPTAVVGPAVLPTTLGTPPRAEVGPRGAVRVARVVVAMGAATCWSEVVMRVTMQVLVHTLQIAPASCHKQGEVILVALHLICSFDTDMEVFCVMVKCRSCHFWTI